MQRNHLVAIVFPIVVLIVGFACESRSVAAEEIEILKITVGQPTKLHDMVNQNAAHLAVSRTGVIAAFYPKQPKCYRTSTDGGWTWGPEMESLPLLAGCTAGVSLREGGVLKLLTMDDKIRGEMEFHLSPMVGNHKDGWFMLHSTFAWFNDDFTSYEVAPVQVYMPDAVTTKQTHLAMSCWPIFADDRWF